ncbi:pyruvate dehydrogenase complex dihydrolipoamide acetyltransferase [Acetobacter orleanensis]|uniref:Acetyltransferase component of pyruvate dehydrogenase complex n=1 Tax=Acetobacter orleanensis TaxID=104099 RepID=A0A4Y3TL85_9PROT|nr:pyruvate dehydrogenase complex dihydrolipoamide acetyltransferase [Acetobacter orleanensis]KXV63110.1 branched-chain alpha-keto acid dehydrogenase subunit E2 [Acetobacter orleanensis]PCD80264.1 pyruvate dehydrogenase complex dihydrolipoamide acetyltransferase [Acetobacter orleanensis]GAN68997.1 dihydrolipoamide acetyltransferase/pyruvate dehydrogenase E2 component [Acetobacter orleanensis JCM 7639]GBR30476.1 dihydrolipoamide acetyltransferase component [Acetobacter orleanensis NRIC 0473]GEB
MAIEVLMPALSPTMTEGALARWIKAEGDKVAIGDVIAEIETDKATMEVEAVEDGILGRILVPEGTQGVAVNSPIAILVAEGEAVPEAGAVKPQAATAPAASPAAATPQGSAPVAAPAPVASTAKPAATGKRILASPLAKRIASQKGLDLTHIQGTGPSGRIVRRDVDKATSQSMVTAASTAPVAASGPTSRSIPHSSMRKVIARRLTEAKSTIPHFYVSVDVELDALLALRSQLNAASPEEGPDAFKLSVNDMLVKASAIALKRVPNVNASFTEQAMVLHDNVDISIAVSIPDGLITPILTRVDQKSLKQISQETKYLVKRARAGKLKPEEFQGGTFSISNMGMFGVRDFSAIINPPQAAILAIAAAKKQAVVKGNELAIATVMTVTLSVDHRVVDGAVAAEWLSAFRSVVESPLTLVL